MIKSAVPLQVGLLVKSPSEKVSVSWAIQMWVPNRKPMLNNRLMAQITGNNLMAGIF